jgi:hypothetical protein
MLVTVASTFAPPPCSDGYRSPLQAPHQGPPWGKIFESPPATEAIPYVLHTLLALKICIRMSPRKRSHPVARGYI